MNSDFQRLSSCYECELWDCRVQALASLRGAPGRFENRAVQLRAHYATLFEGDFVIRRSTSRPASPDIVTKVSSEKRLILPRIKSDTRG